MPAFDPEFQQCNRGAQRALLLAYRRLEEGLHRGFGVAIIAVTVWKWNIDPQKNTVKYYFSG